MRCRSTLLGGRCKRPHGHDGDCTTVPYPDDGQLPDGVYIGPDGVARVTEQHPLSPTCTVCESAPNTPCASMAKRWQAARSRTVGVLDNGWRKTPHKERVQASRDENLRRQAAADAFNAITNGAKQ